MDTKHTPGPWPFEIDTVFIPRKNGDVRVQPLTHHGDYQGMMDAKLIAAAPDLLAALKAVVMSAGYESGEALAQLRELNVSRSVLDNARAAIAKASQ